MKTILVTGGLGFIGSHTVVELLNQKFDVLILDNLDNSCKKVLEHIAQLAGRQPTLVEGDIRDASLLQSLFADNTFYAVVHFAGLKAVGESVLDPLRYYENNVLGSINLFNCMATANCYRLVFSSSATVYGKPKSVPIKEDFALSVTNPYGRTKLMIEEILRDLSLADPSWQISILRYFNPIAAHPSGMMGEDPQGLPNNLMPYIAQVAIGRLKELAVFGDDYATVDGTGVRDYIHVVDLATAHIKALQSLNPDFDCQVHNIGTGQGYSVLEMINAFEAVSGVKIPYTIQARRAGDIDQCYADASLAAKQLGWKAKYDLTTMMRDQWRWQTNHPHGYAAKK